MSLGCHEHPAQSRYRGDQGGIDNLNGPIPAVRRAEEQWAVAFDAVTGVLGIDDSLGNHYELGTRPDTGVELDPFEVFAGWRHFLPSGSINGKPQTGADALHAGDLVMPAQNDVPGRPGE